MIKLKSLTTAFNELKKQSENDKEQLKASNDELRAAMQQLETALKEAQESKCESTKLNDMVIDLIEEKKVL